MAQLLQSVESPVVPLTQPPVYSARVIDRAEAFAGMRDEWNALLKRSGIENLFLRHEWIAGWLKYFSCRHPMILLIRDSSNQLVGGMPLIIERIPRGGARRLLRQASFPGSHISICDHLEIPIDRQADESSVLNALAQALKRESHAWDVLNLHCMSDAKQLQRLATCMEADDYHLEKAAALPVSMLPDTVEEHIARRKRKLRYAIHHSPELLKEQLGFTPHLEFSSITDKTDTFLNYFLAQHIIYWGQRGQPSVFQRYPQLTEFFKELLRTTAPNRHTGDPYMEMSIQVAGNHRLSYQLSIFQGEEQMNYINTYEHSYHMYRPGILHMELMFHESIERGCKVFNFGRGEERYKNLWKPEKIFVWDLRLFANTSAKLLWETDTWLKRLRPQKPASTAETE